MAISRMLSFSTKRLEGKVAIVTGGASGIGESAARLFARHGAKVFIADVQSERGQRVCEEINAGGDSASYLHCDVSKEAEVEAAVSAAVNSHGRLDVMFNNAGTITAYRPIVNTDASDVKKVIAVNMMGVFFGMKHAGRAMISAGSGSIINTASGASVMAAQTVAHYTASKHAVVGLTKDAAVEFGRGGVRVNCVSPHLLASPLTCRELGIDAERIEAAVEKTSVLRVPAVKADDIAEAVLFLASDESRYVNGLNLVVNGGYTLTNPSLGAYLYPSS